QRRTRTGRDHLIERDHAVLASREGDDPPLRRVDLHPPAPSGLVPGGRLGPYRTAPLWPTVDRPPPTPPSKPCAPSCPWARDRSQNRSRQPPTPVGTDR